ncbi:unnamed protein product, partial [Meganyctiphanes norvegica]
QQYAFPGYYTVKYTRKKLSPPSKQPYNLTYPQEEDPSMGQSYVILGEILGEMTNGFFVECGAQDGEHISNTLLFEKKYGWNGLLVEGNPKNYEKVISKKRKAWTIHTCLSTKPYPNTVMFHVNLKDWGNHISNISIDSKIDGYVELQCLPLYSILMALNTTTVDYFSLDIEGLELEVLKTIPWDKVNIRTLSVEHKHIPGGKDVLRSYMRSQGYYIYSPVVVEGDIELKDTIFYRNDVVPKIPGL